MFTEQFIQIRKAGGSAGTDMPSELNNGAFSFSVNEPQLSFWRQINGLLREWVG